MSPTLTFPIAETFYSMQGEGLFAGTPMFFIRLAGCNVGEYMHPKDADNTPFQIAHPEHSTCTSYSGEKFICDTDYRVKEHMSVEALIVAATTSGTKHVCFTGGEPFIHSKFRALVEAFHNRFEVHVETSGTRPIPKGVPAFITCSPKEGFLQPNISEIDQYKFLVRGPADEAAIMDFLHDMQIETQALVWIQPIEELGSTIQPIKPYEFAEQLVLRHPEWRLSLQLHKILGAR